MTIEPPGPVPKSVLQFFRNKGLQVGFNWRDVWRDEHAAAFTVAKAMQLDVLQTIRDAVDTAITEGQTLRQFKRDLMPLLQSKGWWGKADLADPLTGEVINAQLGSPRRLRTIYRANLRSARSAGQYQRAERTKEALPFFLYSLGPSREHRPEHEAWHGTILPIDHEWWATHLPPNGWNCKCRVRQISRSEAKRRGYSMPQPPEINMVRWENKRTGTIEFVPEGIDPGWDTNPGKTRHQALEATLAGKLKTASPMLEETISRDVEDYKRENPF
ncbi:phage minor head protein [Desulfuromonas acetoxidans]|uniref:phage head morphogenesis protein n=1 Tax=Desulfuromonas acetoxidans TaxID=891 RepID=UPI00292FC583|nr:phage minor head protein [Desulfuromonas acetoxidans]